MADGQTVGPAEVKPGIKTSEFWMTIAFHVCAVALLALGKIDAQWSLSAQAIVQAVYNYCRGQAKL